MGIMDYIPQFGQNVGTQDISGYPSDDATAQLLLKRRLAQADLLKQSEMPQGQLVSGIYVKPSWTQYLSNAINKYQGAKQEKEAIGQYGEAQANKQKKLADLLQGKEITTPVDYTEAGNMPGMEQTTRQPYSQQEFMSKAVQAMPDLAPKLIESQIAQYKKDTTPIKGAAGDVFFDPVTHEQIFAVPEKTNKLFGTVSPSDFTPASLAKYAQTQNYGDLVPVNKPSEKSSDQKDFEFAQSQGFKGSFMDFKNQMTPYQKEELALRRKDIEAKAISNFDNTTVDMLADQALAGDKSVFSGRGMTGANIAAVRNRMNQKMQQLGWSGKDIAAQNADFMANVAANRTAAVKGANIELAGNEFTNIAPLAKNAGQQVSRSGFLPFGKVEVMFNEQTNDPNMAQFAAYNNGLINTYARAISPTGVPSVSDKNHARELLLTAKNQTAYNATVDALVREIEAAKRSPTETRGALRGNITGRQNANMPSQDAIAAELARRGMK